MADNPFDASTPPPVLPGRIRPVIPVLARRGEFMPQVDETMSVDLGGEIVAAKVIQVLSDDVIVVEVTGLVIDKAGHGYKKGSTVPMQRTWNGLQEVWTPISERATREKEHLERIKRQIMREEAQKAAAMVRHPEIVGQQLVLPVDQVTGTNIDDKPAGTNIDDKPVNAPRKVLGPRRSKIARST